MFKSRYVSKDVVKGMAAGLVGGLVASWTMNEFQSLLSKISEVSGEAQNQQQQGEQRQGGGKDRQPRNEASSSKGNQQRSQSEEQSQGGGEEGEPATEKAATAISESVFGHELTKSERKTAGEVVHYAMGAGVGALYGVAVELAPAVTAGAGLPFGAVVWLLADEAAVPALGLSKSPTEYPPSTHFYALASHLVYGLTTDIVRRTVRSVL